MNSIRLRHLIHSATLTRPVATNRYLLWSTWSIAVGFALFLGFDDLRLERAARSSALLSTAPLTPPSTTLARSAPAPSASSDFVRSLPQAADADATIRYVTHLAESQRVTVSQMQGETIKVGAKQLGQAKFTLQLRGDYRDIKLVISGLLSKLPGLTLQRLTLRHPDALDGNSTATGSDDASVELIQYLRPADDR